MSRKTAIKHNNNCRTAVPGEICLAFVFAFNVSPAAHMEVAYIGWHLNSLFCNYMIHVLAHFLCHVKLSLPPSGVFSHRSDVFASTAFSLPFSLYIWVFFSFSFPFAFLYLENIIYKFSVLLRLYVCGSGDTLYLYNNNFCSPIVFVVAALDYFETKNSYWLIGTDILRF